MKYCVLTALCLLVVPAAGISFSFDDTAGNMRPVSKVVGLLDAMTTQLEKEGKEDAAMYAQYQCWCKVNGDEKLKAIAESKIRLKENRARIAELAASTARLKVEFTNLGKDVVKYEAAMDQAMAIRKKVMEKFSAEETELLENIDAVSSALKTVQGGTFLQFKNSHKSEKLQQLIADADRLSDDDRSKVTAFLQGTPGGDAVIGVLQGLETDFNQNLESIRADEKKDQEEYEALIKAKRAESDAAKESSDQKKEEHADGVEEMMHKKQDIIDTSATLEEDTKFAKEVKAKCLLVDREFEARTKTRSDEMEAVAKTKEILNSDEAHENFGKTLSFLQTKSTSDTGRERAVATLSAAGKKLDARLVTLSMKAKLDDFHRVKVAIDEMVEALTKEQADEVKHKDYCVEEFNQNMLSVEEEQRTKAKQEAKIADLKMSIKQSTAEIDTLKAEIAELKKQVMLAAQNREAENQEFQTVVADQRQTQVLLKKALAVMSDFYLKQEKAALVQVKAKAPEEPAGFKSYKNNGGGKGIIGMLNQLITDTKAMEVEAISAERTAQANYEQVANDTTAAMEAKTAEMADKTDERAKTEGILIETKENKAGTETELKELDDVNKDLHETCDFVMKNFDMRQQARREEMDALKLAKSHLNGAQ
eukprot:TRINITY_DN2502_c0_g1_i1.p1 TRINITY_DN2502_c0_g1~~TRINITY_DN2502_c0_g1_i1.p1  ORF type:complete len:650 (-),score=250.73 TRINITY_DN2502_c0_g1_i1:106-2055(-)